MHAPRDDMTPGERPQRTLLRIAGFSNPYVIAVAFASAHRALNDSNPAVAGAPDRPERA